MAAEAVRALNHLTMRPPDLADSYAVIGELRILTERLPQALGQLATVLERPDPALKYGTDYGDDPAIVIGAAVIALRTAASTTHDVARRLADAHNAVGHLCIARELAAVDVEPGPSPR